MFEAIGLLAYTIVEILNAFLNAFLSLVPIYEAIENIKDLMWASILGVPVWVTTTIGVVSSIITVLIFICKKLNN